MRIQIALLMCLFLAIPAEADELQPGDVGYGHTTDYHQAYKRLYQEVNGEASTLLPGDPGYRQDEFQGIYKQIYDSGKCACKSGYCRPTDIRFTKLGSKTGYDILISRQWYPVPQSAMQNEHTLSRELMDLLLGTGEDAHVCAYPDIYDTNKQNIECAVFYLPG